MALLVGASAGQIHEALKSALLGATSGLRPFAVVPLTDSLERLSGESVWPRLEEAMAECTHRLRLDPRRRIGMMWDVLLFASHDLRAEPVASLLRMWTKRSRWPLRLTVFVDATEICKPWHSPGPSSQDSPDTAAPWNDLMAQLDLLESEADDAGIACNGAYLWGSANRFGFASFEVAATYPAHLLALSVTSGLVDWLESIPRADDRIESTGKGGGPGHVSAIGFSEAWVPPTPWMDQIARIQAARTLDQYRSGERLASHPEGDRWIHSVFDHHGHFSRLTARCLPLVAAGLPRPNKAGDAECRDLLTAVGQRDDLLRSTADHLREHLHAVGDELARRLEILGNELVLGGGMTAYADALSCIEAQVEAFRQQCGRELAATSDRLREIDHWLSEVTSPHERARASVQTPLPRFFARRWICAARRRRWMRKLIRAFDRALAAEVTRTVNAGLLELASQAIAQLRVCREGLRRAVEAMDAATKRLWQEAEEAFQPALPIARSPLRFDAVTDWVAKMFPTDTTPLPCLANAMASEGSVEVPPWHAWTEDRLREAAGVIAQRQVAGMRGPLAGPASLPDCIWLAQPDRQWVAELLRLSHPLVPVTASSFDSVPQQVFQHVLRPEESAGRWQFLAASNIATIQPTALPWPSIVTVYRDLPVTGLPHRS